MKTWILALCLVLTATSAYGRMDAPARSQHQPAFDANKYAPPMLSYEQLMSLPVQKRIRYVQRIRELLFDLEKITARSGYANAKELKSRYGSYLRLLESLVPAVLAYADYTVGYCGNGRDEEASWDSGSRRWRCLKKNGGLGDSDIVVCQQGSRYENGHCRNLKGKVTDTTFYNANGDVIPKVDYERRTKLSQKAVQDQEKADVARRTEIKSQEDKARAEAAERERQTLVLRDRASKVEAARLAEARQQEVINHKQLEPVAASSAPAPEVGAAKDPAPATAAALPAETAKTDIKPEQLQAAEAPKAIEASSPRAETLKAVAPEPLKEADAKPQELNPVPPEEIEDAGPSPTGYGDWLKDRKATAKHHCAKDKLPIKPAKMCAKMEAEGRKEAKEKGTYQDIKSCYNGLRRSEYMGEAGPGGCNPNPPRAKPPEGCPAEDESKKKKKKGKGCDIECPTMFVAADADGNPQCVSASGREGRSSSAACAAKEEKSGGKRDLMSEGDSCRAEGEYKELVENFKKDCDPETVQAKINCEACEVIKLKLTEAYAEVLGMECNGTVFIMIKTQKFEKGWLDRARQQRSSTTDI